MSSEARKIAMRIIDGALRRTDERDPYTYLREVENSATKWIKEYGRSRTKENTE